jgi:hypothetical protein
MKLNNENRAGGSFKNACIAACQKALKQLTAVKETIFAESYNTLHAEAHLLRVALNEAEAAAFQTPFPQLVFPTLAMEKTQEVINWHRQQEVRRPGRALAWA